ncbi:hypothetical protein SAMN04487962_1262 [Marinobacter segnicrescens]|uniref:Uncharacterized protein n=2 Tax=Marinobacter segnicrescens TaxID=430453 RepID=A0A1I0H9Z0_9GAMM|nr:hypothetical protein SAMN04487962_1262 [Marinobacter segnicrescens]
MGVYSRVQKKFADAYPLLMHQREGGSFDRFGLEVGPGWYPLVYELFGLVDDMQRVTGKAASISQVKEKFGTLRIYCNLPCESIEQDILETVFEDMSSHTCDFCGSPGRLSDKAGWWATRCDKHRGISDFDEAERLRTKSAEEFLKYERQGVITEGLIYADAKRSEKGQGFACLVLYALPERIDDLYDGLMEKLTVTEYVDRPVDELAKIVEDLKKQGKRIAAVGDGSEDSRKAVGSKW